MSVRTRALVTLAFLGIGYALAFSSLPLHLPSVCWFKNLTGLPCAGCNMTHACCALASGRLGEAVRYHIGVIPFALAVIACAGLLAAETIANRPFLGRAWRANWNLLFWTTATFFAAGWAINLARIVHHG